MQNYSGFKRCDSQNFQNINLLDLIPNVKQSNKNIYNFQQFKEWFNNIDFNQTVTEPINSKLKKLQSLRLNQKINKLNNQQIISNQKSNFGLLISGPILQFSKKQKKSQQQLDPKQFLFLQQKQNSIKESQARSSRSRNGYQQINQYEIGKQIGKGAFSQVFQARDMNSLQRVKYAIKVMNKKRLKKKFFRKSSHQIDQQIHKIKIKKKYSAQNYDGNSSEFINNQIAILKKINHKFITKLYEVIIDQDKDKAYLVLEYCQNGFINENKNKSKLGESEYRKLSESECKKYFKQLALAINYLHTVVKIAHRDIKPENILISKNDQVKLSDFGLGTNQLQSDQYSGTRLYMPPENSILQGKKIVKTQTADIWALGISLLIMLTGNTPQYKNNQIIDLNKKIDQLKQISPQLKDFLRKCLQQQPHKRLTSQGMLIHPWICQDPFSLLINKTLIQQFQFIVSDQEQRQAIKDVQIRKERKKYLSLVV